MASLLGPRTCAPFLAVGTGGLPTVDPGEVGRVATAAGKRKLLCFCAVLGWSRWRYVRFFTCQRFQILAQGLASCFDELGGVTARVLFDNAKTVTSYFVAGLSVLNPELVRLATHYRFTPVTAAASDPESKACADAAKVHRSLGRVTRGPSHCPADAPGAPRRRAFQPKVIKIRNFRIPITANGSHGGGGPPVLDRFEGDDPDARR